MNHLRLFACVFALALYYLPRAALAADVEMTFYGNQHFKFVTTGGKVILINPWVKGNPDWPKDMKLLGQMVEDIAYNNAVAYFPMQVNP